MCRSRPKKILEASYTTLTYIDCQNMLIETLFTTVLHGFSQGCIYSVKLNSPLSTSSNWECFIPDLRLPFICRWTGNLISIIYQLPCSSVFGLGHSKNQFLRQFFIVLSNTVYVVTAIDFFELKTDHNNQYIELLDWTNSNHFYYCFLFVA